MGSLLHTLSNHPSLKYLFALSLPAIGQLAMLPLYGYYLGSLELGMLSIVQGSVFVFQILTANVLSAAVARYWHTHIRPQDILKTALVFSGFLTLLIALFIALMPNLTLPGYSEDATRILPIAVLIAGLSSMEAIYLIACVQQKKSTAYMLRTLTHISASIAGAWLFVLWQGPTHVQVLNGRLAGMLIGIMPWWISDIQKGKFHKDVLAALLRFSAPLVPYLLLNQLLQAADRWIIADTAGPALTGYFTAALSLMALSEMAFQALKHVYQPDIFSAFMQKNTALARKGMQQFLRESILLFSLILLVAPVMLMVFFAEGFYIALPLMPWLAIGFAFRLIFMHDSVYEFYAPRFWPLPVSTLTGVMLMLALTPVLIPVAGIAGPGIAFAISRAGMAIVMHNISKPNRVFQAFTPITVVMILLLLCFGIYQWICPETHTLWMAGIGVIGIGWSALQKT